MSGLHVTPNSANSGRSLARCGSGKILLITQVFPPEIGGVGTLMYHLAVSAPETFDVVAGNSHSEDGDPVDLNGSRLFRVDSFRRIRTLMSAGRTRGVVQRFDNQLKVRPRAWRQLIRQVDLASYDAICIGQASACHWLLPRIRRAYPRLPVLMYAHGEEIPRADARWGFYVRDMLRFDGYIAASRYTRGKLQELGISADRIRVVNSGVDIERFSPGPKPQYLADRYNLRGRRVLMTLARLDLRKGHDQVLRALPEVLQSVPDLCYLIVGAGDELSRLQSMTAELGLADHVVFAGRIEDAEVADHYRLADVYIMPNRSLHADTEGFGIVFLEANACGKPVIGGRAGGVPDAIEDGVSGLLVEGESVLAVQEAIVRLFTDTGLAERLGRNGLERARRFAWPTQTERLIEGVRDLMLRREAFGSKARAASFESGS